MQRTSSLSSPVITFLSPSLTASKRARSLLSAVCSFQNGSVSVSGDELDMVFQSAIPGFSRKWDSVASICDLSGSVIHFCSMDSGEGKQGSFSLMGVTDSSQQDEANDAVQEFRNLLATHVKKRSNTLKLRDSMGASLTPAKLLRSLSTWGLPILSMPGFDDAEDAATENQELGLKEIVVPHFDQASYADGSTIQSKIYEARLPRPTMGVYRWRNSPVNIRPLPTAAADQVLPPPSLIFHCTDPGMERIEESGIRTARIGYGGNGVGQLMLRHDDLAGLDIRFCPKPDASSAFCEAQESLMAASLGGLQSANALLSGEKGADDTKLGNADCWIEVRENLKKPSGFLKRSGTSSKQRIAKIPDLPYE
jgi:hypothetical protein